MGTQGGRAAAGTAAPAYRPTPDGWGTESSTLALPCPMGALDGAHAGTWDVRRGRFACRRCGLVIAGAEAVERLADALAELALYRRDLDPDRLRAPALPLPALALGLRVLADYIRADGERGERVAGALASVGLNLPGRLPARRAAA
jgi:hypothetical protein